MIKRPFRDELTLAHGHPNATFRQKWFLIPINCLSSEQRQGLNPLLTLLTLCSLLPFLGPYNLVMRFTLAFLLAAQSLPAIEIARGPYLQLAHLTGMTIVWRTEGEVSEPAVGYWQEGQEQEVCFGKAILLWDKASLNAIPEGSQLENLGLAINYGDGFILHVNGIQNLRSTSWWGRMSLPSKDSTTRSPVRTSHWTPI